jgi:hypothetical protein
LLAVQGQHIAKLLSDQLGSAARLVQVLVGVQPGRGYYVTLEQVQELAPAGGGSTYSRWYGYTVKTSKHQSRILLHACRFKDDQVFEEVVETQIKAVSLIDGQWYVRLDGDLAGKVVGAVYDASAGETELVPVALSVSAGHSAAFVQLCKR